MLPDPILVYIAVDFGRTQADVNKNRICSISVGMKAEECYIAMR